MTRIRVGRGLLAALGASGLALAPGCGGSRSEPARVRGAQLELAAALEPRAGRVGDNHLWLELRDAAGRPVSDAELRVRVHMPAMGAMPAMGGPAAVTALGDGSYRADFDLEMGGTWLVELEARPPGAAPVQAEGSLTVGSPGLRLRALGAAAARPAAPAPHPAEFQFEPGRLQRSGVRTGVAERAQLGAALRAVGRVVYDETRLVDVSTRVRGWVEELRADAVGTRVRAGEVLLQLYSPELHAGQREYLQALRAQRETGERWSGAVDLARAARRRLELWGVGEGDLQALAQRGAPLERLPLRAPAQGYLIEKNVVEGSAVEPGQRLFRIAPLDRVWIEVDLYEQELERVRVGQPARVSLPYLPGRSYEGTVAYVYPYLEGAARTGRARVELANPELELRPDMYASVELRGELRSATVVPQSALLYAGTRSFVFLDLGEGRFRPQAVQPGVRDGERVEILAGLEPGERIVTSGTFLIASESRLRAALEQW
jgi:Cu(I)/Ag(I) efflux system membrane fusion protein